MNQKFMSANRGGLVAEAILPISHLMEQPAAFQIPISK